MLIRPYIGSIKLVISIIIHLFIFLWSLFYFGVFLFSCYFSLHIFLFFFFSLSPRQGNLTLDWSEMTYYKFSDSIFHSHRFKKKLSCSTVHKNVNIFLKIIPYIRLCIKCLIGSPLQDEARWCPTARQCSITEGGSISFQY